MPDPACNLCMPSMVCWACCQLLPLSPCRYDAGDSIKHSFTIAQSSMFLTWAALDFQDGHKQGAVGYQSCQQQSDTAFAADATVLVQLTELGQHVVRCWLCY